MGVFGNGAYGVSDKIIFSYPCVCENGNWQIKQDFSLSDLDKDMIAASEEELLNEKNEAFKNA